MTNIFETEAQYKQVCFKKQIIPNTIIEQILNNEIDIVTMSCKTCSNLYLAGNNPFLNKQKLTDSDIKVFPDWLNTNTYITGLDLRYNCIGNEGAKTISLMLCSNISLISINLMYNDIREEGAQFIAAALHRNMSIKYLRFEGNKIGKNGGIYFAEMLQINTSLEQLNLADCDLDLEALIAVAAVLHMNKTLKSLDVGQPLILSSQEEIGNHYSRMLAVNRTLQVLYISKCQLGDQSVSFLIDCLYKNNVFFKLDLSCNKITCDGASSLAELLIHTKTLKILNLGTNLIRDKGVIQIAKALALHNTSLERLSIVKNKATEKGLSVLASALNSNINLTFLYIMGNKVGPGTARILSMLIDTGRLILNNVDFHPYCNDGECQLAITSNSMQQWRYWQPTFGVYASPELKSYHEDICS